MKSRPFPIRSFLVPCFFIVAAAVMSAAVGVDAPGNSLKARFATAARQACAERGFVNCSIVQIDREQLADDIAHYAVVVQVGEGAFDAITIHRIVRERRTGIEDRVDHTYFFLHGSGNEFLFSRLNGVKNAGLGMYLASRDVDVWGLDLRWVRIPRTQTDFGFMKEWGFDLQGWPIHADRTRKHRRQRLVYPAAC